MPPALPGSNNLQVIAVGICGSGLDPSRGELFPSGYPATTMKTMHTTGFPSTRERDDATLIGVIAAVRAQAPLSQPARVDILLTQGLDALLEEVFGNTLIHPERDAALTQAALDLQTW